jgi:1-acyl-sn-glycerol-3-phosphate acyltransferase
VSSFLFRGFAWYIPRYLRRHFNAVRVAKQTAPNVPVEQAVICFGNHAGWWDPLIAFLLHRSYFSGRAVYAPMDQEALEQYPVFGRLGFYGIDLNSLSGAKRFLYITRELLKQPSTAIWMTPGGTFADVRTRTTFQPGLGHLAATVNNVALVPVAVEYTFWQERTPEALVEFGQPIETRAGLRSKEVWQGELEERLATAQASLAQKAISRDGAQFDTVLEGSAGVGGWYDFARRTMALLSGTDFDPRHSRRPTRSLSDD